MTTAIQAPTRREAPRRRPFTVAEYLYMIETGVFDPEERIELIEGEILTMSPIGNAHSACVAKLNRLFTVQLAQSHVVFVQNPVQLNEKSRPQPDLAILAARADFYHNPPAQPADVQILIEVSDSTLDFDRKKKRAMYARAGIREYWIINLQDNQVEIHTAPANGTYKQTRIAKPGETITTDALPGITLAVDDILV